MGSTSSLMIVAVSEDLTVRRASGVKRKTIAKRSNRMRLSIRSPRVPLARLTQYLKPLFTITKNRNSSPLRSANVFSMRRK